MYKLDWDPKKRRDNLNKHKIDFRSVASVFYGPHISYIDDRFDYGEEREIAYGMIDAGVVVLVYTIRGDIHWIISARKAENHEIDLFFQTIGEIRP
jgi:uncharacterized protein